MKIWLQFKLTGNKEGDSVQNSGFLVKSEILWSNPFLPQDTTLEVMTTTKIGRA